MFRRKMGPQSGVRALLVLAVLYTLYLARDFLIPVSLSALLYLALWPALRLIRRLGIGPRAAASLLIIVVLATFGAVSLQLVGPSIEWLERSPQSLRTLNQKLNSLRDPVEKVSKAADEVEDLTSLNSNDEPAQVKIREPGLSEALFSGAWKILAQTIIVVLLLFFFLASGDRLFLNFLRLVRKEERARVLRLSRDVRESTATYLATVLLINIGLGGAIFLALWAAGMPNPLLWGVMAAVLNFVPYLGAALGGAVILIAALLSFDGYQLAFFCLGLYLAITSLEGMIVTPMLLGRRLTIHPLFLFLSLLFWGWLWGPVGFLLAVPMMVVIKSVLEHSQRMNHYAKLMSSSL